MSDPTISAQFLRHVAHCLELTGVSPDPLLATYGLTIADLDDPQAVVPLQHFLSFFEQSAEACHNPHFGLHAGRLAGADSLGPLGYLFLSAPDLRTAFRSFNGHLATMQQASRHCFYERDAVASFEYALANESMKFRRQDAEYSIATIYNFSKNYVGRNFELIEVRFEHAPTADIRVYRQYFNCDVYFNQDFNGFSFEVSFLDHCGGRLNEGLFPIIEEHLNRRASEQIGGIADAAIHAIENSPLDVALTQEQVARSLRISVPTLNRKLRDRGVSWRGMVRDRRMNAAARMLRHSRRSVAEVALAVGFAESASFIRSFTRHFGRTPSQYRIAGSREKE